MINIETIIKTGQGYTTGGQRAPLQAYTTVDGKPVWLYVVDTAMAGILKKASGYQTINANADVRGSDNRLIKGVIGKLGNLLIMEADSFFGSTEGTDTSWSMDDSSIEIAGLRQYDASNNWTGQADFSTAGNVYSRGLLLGAGALQLGYGKMPDYKFKSSDDFDITSESALEVWMEVKKTTLVLEQGKAYNQAKVSGIDYGCVCVDLQVK